MSAVDARFVATRMHPAKPAVATGVYQNLLARSLYARCRMLPSDSELFDRRAHDCGGLTAAVLGISRLYLEVEASPQVLPATFAEGRMRWLDLPPPNGVCAP